MRTLILLCAAALAASCAPVEPVEMTDAEQDELAIALKGRAPGETVSCVSQRTLGGNRSVGEGVILFNGPGGLVYVNRPPAGCPELTSSRALVTRTTNGQLCRGDIATVIDPTSNVGYGSCGLGDFTPYRRVR